MKRKPLPTKKNEEYIKLLFSQGRSLAHVKAATSSAWDDSVYESLRQAAMA